MSRPRQRTAFQLWVGLVAFTGVAKGHMELLKPYAVYSKSDPQTAEENKDYSMTAPLAQDGSNYPAKKRCTSEILSAVSPVATLVSGEDFEWNLGGTAVHNGGSCQVGITYDNCETIAVMASWIGGCPLSLPYTFKVPELPGADRAFFVWEWSNRSGNRELYQNVAVVAVQGSASEYVGPKNFRANTFGKGTCENPEGTDVVYPNPGSQVFYGGDYSDSSPPEASFSCGEWDNSATVTVKNSGGGSGPTGGSGGDKTEGDTKPTATDSSSSSSSGGSSKSSETTAAAAAETSTGSSSTGGTSSSSASSSGSSAGGTGGAATGEAATSKPSSGGSSSPATTSTPTISSPLSNENSANFIKFGVGVLAVLALGAFAVCLLKRNSTSHKHYSRADSDDDDETDSDDGGSDEESSTDEKSRRAKKHSSGHSRGRSHSKNHRHHH